MRSLELYNKYHAENGYERYGLFQLLAEKYGIKRALYPGCFVHVTPSFVYPSVTYVDTDKRARKFFSDPVIRDFVSKRKAYGQKAEITFHPADYRNDIGEKDESFDLLISQYAGFISQHCKRYLRIGGLLLVNNSHGDASMASIDEDYVLVAVIMRRSEKYRLTEKDLDSYFVPKSKVNITKEYIEKIQRGIAYKKSGNVYLFRRIG
jgi:hypothetical protein